MRAWIHGLVVICMVLNSLTPVVFSWLSGSEGAASVLMQGKQPPAPTETSTPLPPEETVTASPTETPTPLLPEETVTPTETPLPTETVQPTLAVTPTAMIETEIQPTEEGVQDWLEWEFEPAQLAQFGEMRISWRWLHPLPEKAEWILVLPEGVLPISEDQGFVYDPATHELKMGTLLDGSLKVRAEHEILDPEIAFQAWIVADGEVFAKDIVMVPVEPFMQSVSREGGEIRALDERIRIQIPQGALIEDAKFSVRVLSGDDVLPAPAGGMVFEINAADMSESRGINQFNEPIVITAQYDETAVWGDEENLAMVYYDEAIQDWRFLPSAVNIEENTVTAETTHLTTFSFNIQDWQASGLPTLDGATTSLFSGSANYGMSFWLPSGPGGFQPSLALSYSSETVDAADSRTQSSWVGMGWSLDTGYIERNQNGTRKRLEDDTFTLVLNGAGYLLIEDDGDPDGNTNTTDYHTRDESYLLIRRYLQRDTVANKDTSYWVVWDKNGGQYVFADRAVYPLEGCDNPPKEIWRWSLTEARSPLYDSAVDGPKIVYQYDHYTTGKRDCDKTNKPNHLTDVSVYPRTIIYPNQRYRISFIRSGFANQFTQAPERKDYLELWEDETTLMFYQKERLSEIVVEHDADGNGSYETVLRRYDFLYNDGAIFPGVFWPHEGQNGLTVTLSSVREYDGAGNSLPATEFVYGDQMHLTEIKNGYDGRVVFNYETDPWAYTEGPHTYQVNYGQSYRCDNGETFLTKFPGDRFYPGGMVKFSADVRSDGNYQLGISGHSSCNNGQCVWGPVHPSSQTTATDILKMPIHAIEARMRVHNLDDDAECYVSWQRFTALPAHYRVLSKQTFVGNTLIAQTTYSYTGPAVNDEGHSAIAADNRCALPDPSASNYQELERNYACYNRKYAQFRGHAQVTETNSSGIKTIYKFRQDDIYNGKLYEVILQDAGGYEFKKTTTTYAYQFVPTSVTYPYNPFTGVRYWDLTGRWIYTVYQDEWLGDGTGNKLGKRVSYYYDEASQGNLQYGNVTRVYEAAWDGSAWQPYRMQLSRFYPNVAKNMVAYPAIVYTYRCPPGWCQPGGNDVAVQNEMSLALNWYDGATNWWTPPVRGLVTTQKQKLTDNGQFRDTQYEYDAWGNLVKTIVYKQPSASENSLPSGISQTTTTCYGASVSGQPNCPSDGYFTYPLKVINNLGQATNIAYNYNLGVPISEIGPNGAATTTTATYDGFSRLLTIIRPGDSSSFPTVRITYSDPSAGCTGTGCYFSTLAEQRLENGTYFQLRKIYNGAGQLIQTQVLNATIDGVAGKRIVTDFTYNAGLRQQTQSVPYSPTNCTTLYCTPDASVPKTTTTFDLLDRVYTVLYPDNTTDVYYYTVFQNRLVGTHYDRNGHTSQTATNVWGQMISSKRSDVGISYAYDELNRLVQATSASGAITTITYDRAGRKLTLNDPDMGGWSYTYDAIGNLITQTDGRGCTTTLAYDDLNRLVSKTYGAGCPTTATVSYTYDAGTYGIGQQTGMTDGSGSSSWEYDARGRVTKETLVIGTGTFQTNWTYNSADQVKTIRYPGDNANGQGEVVTYTYLPQMALNTVVGTSSYVSSSKYDAVGRLTERNLGSGLRQNYSYVDWGQEGGGRLATLTAGVSPNYNNRLNLHYQYDAVGNITQIQDTLRGGTQTQTFQYDALDRLTSAVATGGTQGVYPLESYTYANKSGNLASKAGVVYGYQDSSHVHAVTHVNGVQKYWYDANGNQTKRIVGSDTYDLRYDADNRLVEVKKNGVVVASFVYNGKGVRVKSEIGGVTTVFVGNLLEWSGSSSTMKKYYYAGGERIGMRTGGTVSYILGDHLGSSSVTTDSAGNNAVYALYKPWGEMRYNSGSLPTKYTYTGQYSNVADFGLMNYNARWYDPALGRFAQADTLIPQPSDPQAWDRYAYVNNSPMNFCDPSGHCPICVIATLVIGVIVLTADTPQISTPPTADGNASNLGDLLQLGIEHASSANIVGRGLEDLQSDPHVKGAQDDIIADIRSDPQYQKQPFEIPISEPEGFTANGPDGNWVTGAVTGNPSFWMVHTANLYATNTHVSADGTISTTWKVEDQFDYLPAWGDHFRTGASYWAYNGFAQLIAPTYHGLLQAEPLSTIACWNQTHPPEKKLTPK